MAHISCRSLALGPDSVLHLSSHNCLDRNHRPTLAMSNDNFTHWVDIVRDHQGDIIFSFNVSEGQLVVGIVEHWIEPCRKAGGGAVSSPIAKKVVGDVPVYMCSAYPGSNSGAIRTDCLTGRRTLLETMHSLTRSAAGVPLCRPHSCLPTWVHGGGCR